MICRAAKLSMVGVRAVSPELIQLNDQLVEAENEFSRLNKIVDDMDGERFKIQPAETLRIRDNGTALGIEAARDYEYRRPAGCYETSEVNKLREPLWRNCTKTDCPDGGCTFEIRPFRPSPEARARADEIIAAYDEWQRKTNKKPRGYRAAERARDKADSRCISIHKQIAKWRATSAAELQVKAGSAYFLDCEFSGDILRSPTTCSPGHSLACREQLRRDPPP